MRLDKIGNYFITLKCFVLDFTITHTCSSISKKGYKKLNKYTTFITNSLKVDETFKTPLSYPYSLLLLSLVRNFHIHLQYSINH